MEMVLQSAVLKSFKYNCKLNCKIPRMSVQFTEIMQVNAQEMQRYLPKTAF